MPSGFVGVNVDGPMFDPRDHVSLASQFWLIRASGVQNVRVTFSWAAAQPYASWTDIPLGAEGGFRNGVGGVPTNFSTSDQIMALAASHRLTVLPTVIYTPSWDAATRPGALATPRSAGPYADYLTSLIQRYGPNGSFWHENPQLPKRPIRMWAIWNEPWLAYYWPRPFVHSYLALLSAAHTAIKRADAGAKVVLAGVPNASWQSLKQFYSVGARKVFDVVDVHPYTRYPAGVMKILGRVRALMNREGDAGKPMIAGEISWTSSLHQTRHEFDWETTPTGQAREVRAILPLLAANRRSLHLIGFDWYTWMGNQYRGGSPWGFSGLMGFHDGRVFAKPALSAFSATAHVLER